MNWINNIFKSINRFFTLEKRFQHYLTFKAQILSVLKSLGLLFIIYLPIIWIIVSLFMFESIHIILVILLSLTILSSIWVYYRFYQYFIVTYIPKMQELPLAFIFKVEMIILMIITSFIIVWIVELTGVIL